MIEYESEPVLWPTFEIPARAVAYGPEACARMLMECGDQHVNVDDGWARSNYISAFQQHEVARQMRYLGGDPDLYRCLKSRE